VLTVTTPDDLRVDTRDERGCAVVAVAGELDVSSVPRLLRELKQVMGTGRFTVVVDLTDVPYMDSSGLSVLVHAHKRMLAVRGTLRVVTSQRLVLKLLRITGLANVLAVYPTLEDALTAHEHDVGG
jgi:anti-sigma B factor antagonist